MRLYLHGHIIFCEAGFLRPLDAESRLERRIYAANYNVASKQVVAYCFREIKSIHEHYIQNHRVSNISGITIPTSHLAPSPNKRLDNLPQPPHPTSTLNFHPRPILRPQNHPSISIPISINIRRTPCIKVRYLVPLNFDWCVHGWDSHPRYWEWDWGWV